MTTPLKTYDRKLARYIELLGPEALAATVTSPFCRETLDKLAITKIKEETVSGKPGLNELAQLVGWFMWNDDRHHVRRRFEQKGENYQALRILNKRFRSVKDGLTAERLEAARDIITTGKPFINGKIPDEFVKWEANLNYNSNLYDEYRKTHTNPDGGVSEYGTSDGEWCIESDSHDDHTSGDESSEDE